ncbi:DUF1549 and DUF1553 domain-containing protein [Tundrisphaera lichenicola]|uniref:DUF1549 and DUF1553 domain-containing protein n=1 Tax=Tundrisphaera lichenicola TaxID=2029860 RepID=UPI003EB87F04
MRVDCLGRIFGNGIGRASLVALFLTSGYWPSMAKPPGDAPEPTWNAEQRKHWAFVPPVRPEPPSVQDRAWIRNPIDAFILKQVEADGLAPAPEADRSVLIRRLRFDLTGLPPSAEEVAAFAADPAPDAYERLVDRLLASNEYGERWARIWLDLARFAESDGFKSDKIRPDAWRYRDWVVQALNEDMPYDRFLTLQLAGDEVEPEDTNAFIATGFNRHWPYEDNNSVPGQSRQWMLDDITDTTTAVVLGLTVACARCHDHKYDPISQKDYYRIQALFSGTRARDDYPVASPEDLAMYSSALAEHEGLVERLRREIDAIEQPYAAGLLKDKLDDLPALAREAFAADPRDRTVDQLELLKKYAKKIAIDPKKMAAVMPEELREVWQARRQEMDDLVKLAPPPIPTATGMTDAGPLEPPVRLLRKGNQNNPGEEVPPGFLSVLGSTRMPGNDDPSSETPGRRTALARWATRPENPLTSRVIVNRLWQHHFGRGIVSTTSDFGTQGATPSHPQLLDWLATELIAKQWSLKAIHRLMVTSATYRQSSTPSAETLDADPDNVLFSRMSRRRLEGEAVRDAMLAVSGKLDHRMGGPSIYPELPPGVTTHFKGDWPVSESESDRNRRSLYVFVRRNLKYPLFDAFDVPDTNLTCPERNISVNAPQALMLLNSGLVVEHARRLAGKVYAEADDRNNIEQLVEVAYRDAFGRRPEAGERERALEFLRTQPENLSGRDLSDSLPVPMPEGPTPAQAAAVVDFCHALLNLNEFVFVD